MMQLFRCALVIASACFALEASAKELSFAIFAPPSGIVTTQIAQPWVEWAQKESGGELQIKIYAGGTLGRNPAQQLKLAQDGVADISWIVPSYTANRFPASGVFELPGLARNAKEGSAAALRMYRDGAFAGFEDVKLVGLFTTDTYDLHLSKPIISIADLKGMKLRSGGPAQNEIITALGAVPVGLPVTQIVESMSRNVVSGTILNWTSLVPFKVEETATFHWNMNLGVTPLAFVMNKASYESLSPKAKSVIDRSPEYLAKLGGDAFEKVRAADIARFKAHPKHTIADPSPAEQKKIDQLLAAVTEAAAQKSAAEVQALRGALRRPRGN